LPRVAVGCGKLPGAKLKAIVLDCKTRIGVQHILKV
jgi:hypothetical protein